MAKWTLQLLGGFHLSSEDGEEITALGRRERAILAYLALTPNQRETRERLASLFWSSRGDEQARHSLVQSTAALRKALGDTEKTVIVSEANSLAIDWTDFDVDALTFRALIEEGSRESLHRATELYADDLLLGLDVRSEEFDEWIAGERERLRSMAVDAHYRLTNMYAQSGDWPAVIDAANRTLELDVLREDVHRLLMAAYAQTGQRTQALQQYKLLAATLERELQVAPDAETEALVEDIKAGRLANAQTALNGQPGAVAAPAEHEAAADPSLRKAESAAPHRQNPWYWGAGATVVLLLAVIVGVTATFWRVPELAPAPVGAYVRDIKTMLQPHPLSIAILTFESHGDSEAADFAEALSSALTTALAISSEMRVISRSDARRFEQSPVTARDIAKTLNVRYLLEGTFNKWGNDITIEAGLIDTQQGQHRIWSEVYRRKAEDFIRFQQDVTFDVIKSLEIRLTEGEQERINRMGGTEKLDAWLAAARGEKHLRLLTPQDNLIARASYERALRLDPNYAGAMEGLSATYFVAARFGWTRSRKDAVIKAKQYAERTLVLDPNRPQTVGLLGSISLLEGDFENAVKLGEQAFSLNPNDSDVAALLAYTLTYTGEPERALSLVNRAINLRPVPPDWYEWLRGRAYRLTRRYDDAIDVLTASTRETPSSALPLIELAAAYGEIGKSAMAKRTADKIMQLSPQFTVGQWISLSPYRDKDAQRREIVALQATGLPN